MHVYTNLSFCFPLLVNHYAPNAQCTKIGLPFCRICDAHVTALVISSTVGLLESHIGMHR